MIPKDPSLYLMEADGSLSLRFLHCGQCAALTFPANSYGCAKCGAPQDSGEIVSRPATGTLLEYVTVHAPLVKGIEPPFVVGDVLLAPGVVEEVVLDVQDESSLAPGIDVEGRACPDPDGRHFECRFAPVAATRKGGTQKGDAA